MSTIVDDAQQKALDKVTILLKESGYPVSAPDDDAPNDDIDIMDATCSNCNKKTKAICWMGMFNSNTKYFFCSIDCAFAFHDKHVNIVQQLRQSP